MTHHATDHAIRSLRSVIGHPPLNHPAESIYATPAR